MTTKSFGEFFKGLRIRKGVTLREFCLTYDLDPGNISKLERGVLTPPQDMQKLKDYARNLGIKEGSPDWHTFVDLASAGAGTIPQDILDDQELVKRLPVLFRSLRRKKLTKESLKELIEKLKKV
jgi:transcriptional regulator with XRE-family HTH domain